MSPSESPTQSSPLDYPLIPPTTVGARVLVVDDQDDIRRCLAQLLGVHYCVEVVEDGAAALVALQREPADLVLTDVMMPRLDGIQLVRALRDDPRTRLLPVILLSVLADEDARVQGLTAGADDYLTKPFGVRELLARVEMNLRMARLRTQAESSLHESAGRLTHAEAVAQFGHWEWNLRANRMYWSAGVYSVIGVAETTPPSLDLVYSLIHPEEREAFRTLLERILQGESIASVDLRGLKPNGEEFFVHLQDEIITGADGRPQRLFGTLQDITARKRVEYARERLLAQMKTFVHMISHDLRVPLTIIQGHVGILQDSLAHNDEQSIKDSADAIEQGVKRMDLMISDLMEVARLEGGQVRLALHPLPLKAYLTDLLTRTAAVLPTERIRLLLADGLPPVVADEARLERILMNLFTNAKKYSAPATPIDVHAHLEGETLAISVSDHGPGIHPDDRLHLFDRFYRAQGERHAEGIGLGLYITKLLVEAHGGQIWVTSEVGVGSTFTFTLPIG
jgi:PAS domain S-box-containing protein